MLRYTAIGLAAAASLSLAAMTPALADIPSCAKQPNADTCPTFGAPSPGNASQPVPLRTYRHTHYRYEPMLNQKNG